MKLKIKKGDRVEVLTGKDKGKSGKVIRVDRMSLRVTVEGINFQMRHRKATGSSPSGIDKKEGTIHYSNVMLLDSNGKRTRIGSTLVESKGKKRRVRIAKTTGELLK